MAHLKRYINRERGSKKERERGTEKGERGTEKGERGTEKGETVATHFQPILSTNIFSFENRRVTTSLSLSLSLVLSHSFSTRTAARRPQSTLPTFAPCRAVKAAADVQRCACVGHNDDRCVCVTEKELETGKLRRANFFYFFVVSRFEVIT